MQELGDHDHVRELKFDFKALHEILDKLKVYHVRYILTEIKDKLEKALAVVKLAWVGFALVTMLLLFLGI